MNSLMAKGIGGNPKD